MEHLNHKKGQGATEYLVLLAVVLIVAMVAIALLGFFPGLAGDAKIAQSDSYWRGQARPFAVLEHSQGVTVSDGNLTLVVQNIEADQRLLNYVSVAGSGASTIFNSTVATTYFSAGEKKVLSFALSANCSSGNSYEYYLNFSYNNSDNSIVNRTQIGTKTLVGKCS